MEKRAKLVGLVLLFAGVGALLLGCARLLDSRNELAPMGFQVDAAGRAKVLIAFADTPEELQLAAVRSLGGDIRYVYHLVPAVAATVPGAIVRDLKGAVGAIRVEPDVKVYAYDTELDNAWGVKRIGAGAVHDVGGKGTGIKVAILDSGIDYTHTDLDANYTGGYDFVNDDGDPMDDNGHGTHVAGTVAAEDNGVGVVGVAPEADLYALKVLGSNGSGDFSDVIAALQWCVDNGIEVTNNSYGSSQDPGATVQQAFDNAAAAGVVHVASAGNSGNPPARGDNVGYPARYNSVIAVAATDSSDSRAKFSSTGLAVELAAPGVSVPSTYLGGLYATMSGTSMAAPHVTGTVALCIETYGTLPSSEIRSKLTTTAEDLGASGWDALYGYGLVNADGACGIEVPPPPPPSPGTMYVAASDLSLAYAGPLVRAQVSVMIASEGDAVEGATVLGHWYGATSQAVSGITDAAGWVSFRSDKVRSPEAGTTYGFCVDDVVKTGWPYDPALNAVDACSEIKAP